MARQLERLGEVVERVILIDTPAPDPAGSPDLRALACWFLEDLDVGFDPKGVTPDELPRETPAGTLAAALELMNLRQGRTPVVAVDELLPIFDVFRGIIHATRAYRCEVIRAPLSVLRADHGQVGEHAGHPSSESDDWGWGRWTRATAQSTRVPGNHHTMFEQPHAQALVEALRHHLGDTSEPVIRP